MKKDMEGLCFSINIEVKEKIMMIEALATDFENS